MHGLKEINACLQCKQWMIGRFPSVVGGGANGTVIHYSRNDKQVSLLHPLYFCNLSSKRVVFYQSTMVLQFNYTGGYTLEALSEILALRMEKQSLYI